LTTSNILPQLSSLSPDIRDTFAAFLLAELKYIKRSDAETGAEDEAFETFQRLVHVFTYVTLPVSSCSSYLDWRVHSEVSSVRRTAYTPHLPTPPSHTHSSTPSS